MDVGVADHGPSASVFRKNRKAGGLMNHTQSKIISDNDKSCRIAKDVFVLFAFPHQLMMW